MILPTLFSFSGVLFLWVCSASKLSNFIPRCSMSDPKLGQCIVNAAEKLRKPIQERGIAEMGIPVYDPLVLSSLVMEQESDMMNYTVILQNCTFRGMDNYDISEIQFDPETTTFKGRFEFDPLSIVSGYSLRGTILFIPARGKGNFHMALGPINGTFEITGNISERNNLKYYDFEEIKIRMDIDDIQLYLQGLFDGDTEKESMTNELINLNSKIIAKAVTPVVEQLSEKFITRYFAWLTKKYLLHELFVL